MEARVYTAFGGRGVACPLKYLAQTYGAGREKVRHKSVRGVYPPEGRSGLGHELFKIRVRNHADMQRQTKSFN